MLSIEQTKKLLKNQNISDEEAEKIRDDFRMLAEIAFEKWQKEKAEKSTKEKEAKLDKESYPLNDYILF